MHNILKLENALNFRDLGGYQSGLGGEVKRGVLFRSDSLAKLHSEDIKIILGKNIRTVIDLRTDFEIFRGESKLKGVEGVGYYKISLMDNVHSQDYASFEKNMPVSMGALYKDLIDNFPENIIKVFDTILSNSENAVVFNCTAGKDRTGVIAALILDLLDVGRQDIVENYIVTEQLLKPTFELIMKHYKDSTGREMPRYLLESKRESIEEFLDHLHSNYGNAKSYLLKNGFGEENTRKFIETYLKPD